MPDAAGPESPGPAGGPRHADPDGTPAPALPRLGHRARHRDRSTRLRPLLRGALLALAALVVAAALVPRLAGAPADGPGTTAPAPAAGEPGTPAAWLPAALPPTTDLAAPDAVREELSAAGVPPDRLRSAEAGVASGSLLAVTGAAPPGSRVVARFDRPGGGELLVVDPRPGEPTAEQLERRRSLAEALLANPTTVADPEAAEVLRSGEVDLRLLSLLAALAAREGVGVAAFPVLPGEEDATTPARRVLVDAVGGAAVPDDPAATDRLRAWLAAQRPPFRPDDVQVTDDGVLVSYRYAPDPDALVADATR
ncbi:hypothetical protein ACI780_00145 [Geodermatophilus sp. SYSU D00814]